MSMGSEHWLPVAAYLYALHLDGPGLAWEYLRRHPDYRSDWLHRRCMDVAGRWGLRLLENPDLDARVAHPAWYPDHASVVHIQPDIDPLPDPVVFAFWRLPGRKQLTHDGRRLLLITHWPGGRIHLAIAPGLEEGMAYGYLVRASGNARDRARKLVDELAKFAMDPDAVPAATVRPRPSAAALLELHTLQALDATLAGASLRDVAEGIFGPASVAQGWHADGGLRSRVRRLVRRGRALMRGGYRRLLGLD